MKVLVTGGAGFIGSHIVDELLEHEYQVIVVDNLVTGSIQNIPNSVNHYNLDINDEKLEDVFRKETPSVVIHLAAQASVTNSMENPYNDFRANLAGTVKLLLYANRYNVRKFLFASTAAVYGEPVYLPIDERHPIDAQSFYALSKYSSEQYVDFFSRHFELQSCILRFSNVYGPRQNSKGEAGVVSIFMNQILRNDPVTIFDGSQTRDFVYVKDVANACRTALESDKTGVYHISSCTETTINELYTLISNEIGVHYTPNYAPKRIGEIDRSMLDNKKIIQTLNWKINYALSEGLRETYHYYADEVKDVNPNNVFNLGIHF